MKLHDFGLLTDENVQPQVVASLRLLGFDVLDVKESLGQGKTDDEILQLSVKLGRVVVTHDRDFGRLAVAGQKPVVGILYLRPGHIGPRFIETMFQAVTSQGLDLTPPFIMVAERDGTDVRIRVRQWPP